MAVSSVELMEDPVARYPAATVACFDPTTGDLPRRSLDEARTVEYLQRLAAAGAESLLIASSTGQGHLRTVAELDTWLRCAATAELGDTVLMALLRPEDGVAANERLLDLVAGAGYVAVFFRPGTDLPADAGDGRIADSLAPLVAAAASRGLAVGLYSVPDVSGVALSPEAVARLLAGPGGGSVVAVKVTEPDYEASTRSFLRDRRLGRLKIVQGWDPHLARALRDGPGHDPRHRQRSGITSGLMALAPQQYLHILRAAEAEDWDEVSRAQEAVDGLFRAMQDDPRHFADLQRAKYVMGLGHPLLGTVENGQARRIMDALASVQSPGDRARLAAGLDLMGDGPFHQRLLALRD